MEGKGCSSVSYLATLHGVCQMKANMVTEGKFGHSAFLLRCCCWVAKAKPACLWWAAAGAAATMKPGVGNHCVGAVAITGRGILPQRHVRLGRAKCRHGVGWRLRRRNGGMGEHLADDSDGRFAGSYAGEKCRVPIW